MIVDASALVAILRLEPESAEFQALISAERSLQMSAITLVEASIALTAAMYGELDEFITAAAMRTVPFDASQARVAREAWAVYGKRSGSPAQLNFGDCMVYALAKTTGEPLLFKGDDFTHTDVTSAR